MNKCFNFIFLIILFEIIPLEISFPQIASLEATFTLKKIDDINIPFQNGMPVPSFEKQDRYIIDLKGEWKKERFAASDDITLAKRDSAGISAIISEAQNRYSSSFNDNSWDTKNIPSVENQMNTYPSVPEYYEDGVWYRKSFNVSDSLEGKFIKLIFYAVNYVADVWLNDVYLGYHEGGYTPFAFDVSSVINFNGNNILAVRVDNPAWGTRNDIVPYVEADWFNYTGIIHDVYLEVSNPTSIIRTDIVTKNIDGSIQTSVFLYNKDEYKNVNISIEIFNADINEGNIKSEKAFELTGSPVSVEGNLETSLSINKDSAKVWQTNLKIINPNFWFPKSPDLYIMKVTLKENEEIIDEFYTQFGLRIVRTSGDKVYLNDKPVFFTGVARHEDHPVYGRSIPVDIIYEDLVKVKDVNANMLRTAHYPNHPYTYLIADRLGIAIVEEIPVWWFDASTPWLIQNSLRHIHEQMFREMVFKDYNRPSILLWSLANECLDVYNRKTFIQKIKDDISSNYPDGRLITQSAAADRPGPEDPSQEAGDVAGWTMYFGIFHGGTYYDGTKNFLDEAKIKYPLKPILDTEFGYWSGENNSSLNTQVNVFNETFRAFTENASVIKIDGSYNSTGYLMGVTWWCIFDWYTHTHPQGFQSMGLFNMNRGGNKPVKDLLKNSYKPYFDLGGIAVITDVDEKIILNKFNLEQNFPNPFNPVTKINYTIPVVETGHAPSLHVSLKIYDLLGNEIVVLVDEFKPAGYYEVEFNASDLASGIYFYTLKAGNLFQTKKMILLK